MGYYDRYERWPPYVSVAERKQKAMKHAESLKKKGIKLNPVMIEGRTIAKTFWGKAWCDNLEAYSDFANRLPRGRTYARNGSVIDLQITKGQIKAQVMGSSLYHVSINVKSLPESKWESLIKACAGKIDSLIELLQGKFSKAVMELISRKDEGLFPKPKEISMKCSCPDSASMCKHIAAVLYGVGATLDIKPEWIFELRCVDHMELIATASQDKALIQNQETDHVVEDSELSALFGIELDTETSPKAKSSKTTKKTDPSKKITDLSKKMTDPSKKVKVRSQAEKAGNIKKNSAKAKTSQPTKNSRKTKTNKQSV